MMPRSRFARSSTGLSVLLLCVFLALPSFASATTARLEFDPKLDPGVELQLDQKPRNSFFIGAGFSSQQGFLMNAGVEGLHLFGKKDLNLRLNAKLSALEQSFQLTYFSDPLPSSQWFWEFGVNTRRWQWSSEDDATSTDVYGGYAKLGYRFTRNWSVSFSQRLSHQQMGNAGWMGRLPIAVGGWKSPQWLNSSQITLEYRSDKALQSMFAIPRGVYWKASLETTIPAGDQSARFTRLETSLTYGKRLPWNFHLVSRTRVGMTFGKAGDIPLLERFHVGGPQSNSIALPTVGMTANHRGQQMSLGGVGMLYHRTELLYRILPGKLRNLPIYFFLGGEVGAVLNQQVSSLASLEQQVAWNAAVSMGILWNSPIGPLRFSWGLPVKVPGGASNKKLSPVFSFSLGF